MHDRRHHGLVNPGARVHVGVHRLLRRSYTNLTRGRLPDITWRQGVGHARPARH